MNDLERERWEQHRGEIAQATSIVLHVLTKLPANSVAFEELMKAVNHLDAAHNDMPEYSKDPSL